MFIDLPVCSSLVLNWMRLEITEKHTFKVVKMRSLCRIIQERSIVSSAIRFKLSTDGNKCMLVKVQSFELPCDVAYQDS